MDDDIKQRMIGLALSRLTALETAELLRLAEIAVDESGRYQANGAILGVLKNDNFSTAFKTMAVLLNRTWRAASQPSGVIERIAHVKKLAYLRERLAGAFLTRAAAAQPESNATTPQPDAQPTIEDAIAKAYELNVGRTPVQEEIEIWLEHFENGLPFHQFLVLMARSPEARKLASTKNILEEKSDGAFVQAAYDLIHGRGCKAWELNHWVSKIHTGSMRRPDVLAAIFNDAVKMDESAAAQAVHDGLSCQIMGTSRFVTAEDWKEKGQALRNHPAPAADNRYTHRFHIKSKPRFLVSAIASLYRGGDFIEQFMDNITSQSCFDDYCELVIVDADSPENEFDTIKRYLAHHKGINYIRMNYRIGIYDAWNVGAKVARGEYLTNTNMDDLRRQDSMELQAAALDNLPFVDVVYQDFYYTFDPRLSFEEIAAFGYESNLPIITPYNMMEFNSPHNAPMWRKSLHDELGYFDTHFKSAGDYEFWMRCLAAGKCFYKLNDPHVVYYQNPKGLSTRPETRGITEGKEIHRIYGRKLISENLVMPFEQFCSEKLPTVPAILDDGQHDRYAHAQHALRDAARVLKYT